MSSFCKLSSNTCTTEPPPVSILMLQARGMSTQISGRNRNGSLSHLKLKWSTRHFISETQTKLTTVSSFWHLLQSVRAKILWHQANVCGILPFKTTPYFPDMMLAAVRDCTSTEKGKLVGAVKNYVEIFTLKLKDSSVRIRDSSSRLYRSAAPAMDMLWAAQMTHTLYEA